MLSLIVVMYGCVLYVRPAQNMNETPACQHRRTRLIAKDKDAEYVECLDCGALLEAGEVPEASRTDSAGFDESLSDA
jgi:hypothetical protein